MDIRNKTPRPLKISLPGGGVLRLGPKMVGQITAKAADFEPVRKLIDEGIIEIVGDGGTRNTGREVNDGGIPNQRGGSGGGAMRHSGDR